MCPKAVATFLILSALTVVCAEAALAQGTGFKRHEFNWGDSGHFRGRGNGFNGRGHPAKGVGVWGFVDDGYGGEGGPDWYGISSGYDPCPVFRQRVKTRDGWHVRMVPVC